jgi:thiamine pyrophosphokinase
MPADKTIILADGAFPANERRLQLLKQSDRIVCCDGAVQKLLEFGKEPFAIVGDMDSLSLPMKERFADRLYPCTDQETNDLTKAIDFCSINGFLDVVILGATGLREDHTIGNISLLADYLLSMRTVYLLTDYGRIDAIRKDMPLVWRGEDQMDSDDPTIALTRDGKYLAVLFNSFTGQQVSLFALDPKTHVSAFGLRYPLENRNLTSWWQGTLNEATSIQFSLSIDQGALLIYRLDK